MPRIAIIHPEGNIANNPNLFGIVEILCEQGYEVDYYCRRQPHFDQQLAITGVHVYATDIIDVEELAVILPHSAKLDSGVKAEVRNAFSVYDLLIGIDRGIIETAWLARRCSIPYGLISYEIYFGQETGLEFKRPEQEACQDISFAVCQDRVRSLHLARENSIPLAKIIDIPVAGRAVVERERSYVLHDLLNLDRSCKIALYIGETTSKWSGFGELLESTRDWDESWALVLHHRYGQYSEEARRLLKNSTKAYCSPFPQLKHCELPNLLNAADLGIAFYLPQMESTIFQDRNNLLHIGMASGKIATYLQHGLPIIVNEIGLMSEYVRQLGLGTVVSDILNTGEVLQKIDHDVLADCSIRAKTFFRDYLDLNKTVAQLLDTVDALIGGFRYYSANQRCNKFRAEYINECDSVINRELHMELQPGSQYNTPPPNITYPLYLPISGEAYQKREEPQRLTITMDSFHDFAYAKKNHFAYFKNHDLELFNRKIDPDYCDLKAYQDLLVFTFIKDNIPKGAKILDIGGGDSRILKYFKDNYECWNIDKLEGVGNGPLSVVHDGYNLVRDYIGNFNDKLPENYFDFVFSISTLEHVPDGRDTHKELYKNICLDIDRVLKPSGISLHCFDITISDNNHCWTNEFVAFMSEYFAITSLYVPIEEVARDPELYVISECFFKDYWTLPNVNWKYEDGKPSSQNLLWRKPTESMSCESNNSWNHYNKFRTKKNNDYPKISVVTPSFNQADFLEECIESILGQNYPNLEYIIMDGGSTDGSVDIIRRYSSYISYWQSQADGGQYQAINDGFLRTTGEIMTWLNSDDKFHPGSFETVSAIFNEHQNVEWIMGRPNGFDQEGHQSWILDYLPLWDRKKYLNKNYSNPYIQQEGTFWRRSLWEKAGKYISRNFEFAGDLELWARFFRYAQLYSVDALLAGYRQHPQQKAARFLDLYNDEAEAVLDAEQTFFEQSTDKRLLSPPLPILCSQKLDQLILDKHGINSADTNPSCASNNPLYLISAIVSTYNSEQFIRGCLEDLTTQTLFSAGKLEIIVIDSASPQNEGAIVGEFIERFGDRIVYMRTDARETIYQAWNRGIKAACGKYITNANTDDRHRPDAMELLAATLDVNPDVALVYGDCLVTNFPNQTFEHHVRCGYHIRPDYLPEIMLSGCHMGPQPMWRKSIHDAIGYFSDEFSSAGDYEFWCRIAIRYRMLHIPQFLGLYFENPRGFANSDTGLSARESLRIKIQYGEFFPAPLGDYSNNFQYWENREDNEFVHIIIVAGGDMRHFRGTLESLLLCTEFPHVITIVDTGCSQETKGFLASAIAAGWVTNLLVLDENTPFHDAVEAAARLVPQARWRLVIGNRLVFHLPGWLTLLMREVARFPAAIKLTNRLWSRDRAVRSMAGLLPVCAMDDESATCVWFERSADGALP